MRIKSTKPTAHVAIVKAAQEVPDPTLNALVKSNKPVGAVDDEVMTISRRLMEQQGQRSAAQAILDGNFAGLSRDQSLWRVAQDSFDHQRFGGQGGIIQPTKIPMLGLKSDEHEALKTVAEMGTKALKGYAKKHGYGLHVGGVTTLWHGAKAAQTWSEQGLTWESAELSGKTFAGVLKAASGLFPDVPYLKTASDFSKLVVMIFGVVADGVQASELTDEQGVDKMLIALSRPAS